MTPAALPFTRLAHAKLNLRLEVGPLAGRLHLIVSALAALELADVVRFEPSYNGFHVLCDLDDVPETDNLAWRAASALRLRLPDVRVVIEKRIPTQAGLGGGSADAAATLEALAAIFAADGMPIEPERLAAAALHAGSDVPSFLASGTRIIGGVGDLVTARACMPPPWGILLLRPAVASSTANAYALLDDARVPYDLTRAAEAAHAICDAFCLGDFDRTISLLHNDFASTIEAALPPVAEARDRLRRLGARATILCGSGSCVAGFFKEGAAAHEALAHLEVRDGEWITATTFARV